MAENPISRSFPIPIAGEISVKSFQATVFLDLASASRIVILPLKTPSAFTGPPSIFSSFTMLSGV